MNILSQPRVRGRKVVEVVVWPGVEDKETYPSEFVKMSMQMGFDSSQSVIFAGVSIDLTSFFPSYTTATATITITATVTWRMLMLWMSLKRRARRMIMTLLTLLVEMIGTVRKEGWCAV